MSDKKGTDINKFTLRLTADLNDWLDDYSSQLGISKNALILLALHDYRKMSE